MNRIAHFLRDVQTEHDRAALLHGEDFASLHKAYAVLLEEVEEFKNEVFARAAARDPAHIRAELTQIAAVCAKAARLVEPQTPADHFAGGVMEAIHEKGGR